jgi:hypothetical protein
LVCSPGGDLQTPSAGLLTSHLRCPAAACVKIAAMSGRDDDDWVGTPPEGRYTRDRAKPEFWWRQRPIVPAFVGIFVIVVIILIVALLS